MDEADLQQPIHQNETQLNELKYFLSALQIYFTLQLVIVNLYLITPSLYDYQTALLQYLFHLQSVLKVKRTLYVIPESQFESIHQFIQQVEDNNYKLQKANEYIYFTMFIVGNVVLLQNALKINLYVLVVQLLLGWISLTIAVLLTLVLCILIPLSIHNFWASRRIMHTDSILSVRSLNESFVCNPITFESLKIDVNHPCYICLDEFQTTELVVQLACNQNHIFHSECLIKWAEISDTCPVCRQRLLQQ